MYTDRILNKYIKYENSFNSSRWSANDLPADNAVSALLPVL